MVDANTREAIVTAETEPVVIAAAIVIVVIVTAVSAAVSAARRVVTVVAVSAARPVVTVVAVSVTTAVASAAVAVGAADIGIKKDAAAIAHAAVAAVSKMPAVTERPAREPREGVTNKEIVTKVRDAASAVSPTGIAVIAAVIAAEIARRANARTAIVRVRSLQSAIRIACRMTSAIA